MKLAAGHRRRLLSAFGSIGLGLLTLSTVQCQQLSATIRVLPDVSRVVLEGSCPPATMRLMTVVIGIHVSMSSNSAPVVSERVRFTNTRFAIVLFSLSCTLAGALLGPTDQMTTAAFVLRVT